MAKGDRDDELSKRYEGEEEEEDRRIQKKREQKRRKEVRKRRWGFREGRESGERREEEKGKACLLTLSSEVGTDRKIQNLTVRKGKN